MDIRVLRYFLTVAREESFSHAAEKLFLSQPTLSRQIKDMEEAVENGSQEAKEFIAFTKRQNEHNALVEKLLKIVAGCAIGVVAVAAVSALILVPRISALVSDANAITAQAKEMLPQAAQAVSDAQQVAQQLKDANPQQLLENLNGLSQQGQQALTESMEELKKAVDVLESIDIEALNEAVDNLGQAVSPLARLFGGR